VLERSAGLGRKPWFLAHAATAVALAVGIASLIAGYWLQFERGREITQIPDLRVTLPLAALAAAAGIVAFRRREPYPAVAVLGVGMAGTAVVLGWFLVVAAVGGATLLLALIAAKLH
jgi:divalent metal cation (Fe/Co/Zn/Cd) transporter